MNKLVPNFDIHRFARGFRELYPEYPIDSINRGDIDFANGVSVAVNSFTAHVSYPIDGKYQELPMCHDENALRYSILKAFQLIS